MDHMTWIALTKYMTNDERSKLFSRLSNRKQNKLMKSTFNYLLKELGA